MPTRQLLCMVICTRVLWKFYVSMKSLGMILPCVQPSTNIYLEITLCLALWWVPEKQKHEDILGWSIFPDFLFLLVGLLSPLTQDIICEFSAIIKDSQMRSSAVHAASDSNMKNIFFCSFFSGEAHSHLLRS